MTRGARRSPLPWLGGLIVVYLAVPIVAFAFRFLGAPRRGFHVPGLFPSLFVSLESATISLALITLLGVPLAYVLARHPGRLASLIGLVVLLPLALPPLMSGILLIYLVGPYTYLGQLFDGRLTNSLTGIVLAQTFCAAPFLIVAARSAFGAVDPATLDMAATLGHSELSRFRRVALPQAAPGIRAGMVLAWLRAFGEYGAVIILAYHPFSLPVYTYNQFSGIGLPTTLAPTALAFAVAAVVITLGQITPGRRRPAPALVPAPEPPATAAPAPVTFDIDYRIGPFRLALSHRSGQSNLAILGPSGSGKSTLLRSLASNTLQRRTGRATNCSAKLPEEDGLARPEGPRTARWLPPDRCDASSRKVPTVTRGRTRHVGRFGGGSVVAAPASRGWCDHPCRCRGRTLMAERDGAGRDGERERGGAWVGKTRNRELNVGVYRQRIGVVGQQNGRSVFAERAQPGEEHAGPDAGRGVRDTDLQETGEVAVSERGGHLVKCWVDAGERGAGRDDEERCRHERLREDHPGERVGEPSVEQPAECRVRPEDVDQEDPAHQWRKRERELHGHADDAAETAAGTGQRVRQRDPERAISAVEMLAPRTDTRNALHSPGVPNPRSWDPANRMSERGDRDNEIDDQQRRPTSRAGCGSSGTSLPRQDVLQAGRYAGPTQDRRDDEHEPVTFHRGLRARAEEVVHERFRGGLVRCVLEHGDRVGRSEDDTGEGNGRDLRRLGFRGVEESDIELFGLQPPNQGVLGIDVVRRGTDRLECRRAVGGGRLVEGLHRERTFGVRDGIGPTDENPRFGQHLIPRFGLERSGELARRVVAEHQWRHSRTLRTTTPSCRSSLPQGRRLSSGMALMYTSPCWTLPLMPLANAPESPEVPVNV